MLVIFRGNCPRHLTAGSSASVYRIRPTLGLSVPRVRPRLVARAHARQTGGSTRFDPPRVVAT